MKLYRVAIKVNPIQMMHSMTLSFRVAN